MCRFLKNNKQQQCTWEKLVEKGIKLELRNWNMKENPLEAWKLNSRMCEETETDDDVWRFEMIWKNRKFCWFDELTRNVHSSLFASLIIRFFVRHGQRIRSISPFCNCVTIYSMSVTYDNMESQIICSFFL